MGGGGEQEMHSDWSKGARHLTLSPQQYSVLLVYDHHLENDYNNSMSSFWFIFVAHKLVLECLYFHFIHTLSPHR
jgi:hypothetical protein